MKQYAQYFTANVPQSEPVPLQDMVKNAAGGYVFKIDDWKRLRRFLILGSDTNTFYESSRKLTIESATIVKNLLSENGKAVVDEIVLVSDQGLGIKNDPAVFALALASIHGDLATRQYAFANLSKVCRIGTHLFQFATAREALGGGWGRGMRKAVANWYKDKPLQALIYQVLKYRQRDGWSQRDLLRLCHAKSAESSLHNLVFDAICHDKWEQDGLISSPIVEGFLSAQGATSAAEVAKVIERTHIPREFIPTQFLNDPIVWDAMLPTMPVHALVRNLGNMTKIGLLAPLSEASRLAASKLEDAEQITRSRLHPWSVMLASKVYSSGKSVKGAGVWSPVLRVRDALDTAFELSFKNATPTGKAILQAVDVSGSMETKYGEFMSAAEAAVLMALITTRIEPNAHVIGFNTSYVDLGISAKDSVENALSKMKGKISGGTNGGVAAHWALTRKIKVDAILIYTDNETWAGHQHVFQTIRDYRNVFGPTKVGVCGFTATDRSIAQQNDPLSMDFAGMSSDLPTAISMFVQE